MLGYSGYRELGEFAKNNRHRLSQEFNIIPERVPSYSSIRRVMMGVCAAFIFAAQMINFPIPGGTSGHLLGGTLAGVLLGPWAGSLVMAVVFIVQALFFQDGGLTVLGANIVNMGLIGTFGGYYLYLGIRKALGFTVVP